MSETAVATQERAPAFNLLDEPWIPVRRPDGRLDEVGLLTLFRQSRDIEGLAETSPPSLVALHRLLLAVTHRALTNGVGRWVTDDRVRWYNEGLPITALVNYLEQWRERFWLFHPTHPFMQVAALAGPLPAKALKRFDSAFAAAAPPARWLEAKPWMQIALESVSGNNPVVFDHSTDEAPQPISAGLALRHLLAYLQYAPWQPVKGLCNTGNDLSGPIFNSASVIPLASTLHRSLMLGLAPPVFDMSHDLPSWERDQLTVKNLLSPAVLATGVCDRLPQSGKRQKDRRSQRQRPLRRHRQPGDEAAS